MNISNKNISVKKNTTERRNELYTLIGNRIKAKRLELNISDADLAKQLAISIAELQNIEQGTQKFSVDFLAQIAMILNIDKMYLLTGINNDILKEDIRILDNYIEFFKMIKSISYKNRERLYDMLDNNFTPKIRVSNIKKRLNNK